MCFSCKMLKDFSSFVFSHWMKTVCSALAWLVSYYTGTEKLCGDILNLISGSVEWSRKSYSGLKWKTLISESHQAGWRYWLLKVLIGKNTENSEQVFDRNQSHSFFPRNCYYFALQLGKLISSSCTKIKVLRAGNCTLNLNCTLNILRVLWTLLEYSEHS